MMAGAPRDEDDAALGWRIHDRYCPHYRAQGGPRDPDLSRLAPPGRESPMGWREDGGADLTTSLEAMGGPGRHRGGAGPGRPLHLPRRGAPPRRLGAFPPRRRRCRNRRARPARLLRHWSGRPLNPPPHGLMPPRPSRKGVPRRRPRKSPSRPSRAIARTRRRGRSPRRPASRSCSRRSLRTCAACRKRSGPSPATSA